MLVVTQFPSVEAPPSDEKIALYAVIVTVNLEDCIVASGRRVDGGILLEGLRVVEQE